MWRFRFIIYLKQAPVPPSGETASSYILNTPSHVLNTAPFCTFAKLLNPPPTLHRPAAAAGLKKRVQALRGRSPPPICNHTMSVSGVFERIHMRAGFAGRLSF